MKAELIKIYIFILTAIKINKIKINNEGGTYKNIYFYLDRHKN